MSNESHIILAFLKFGSEENIIDLYNNGTIYMNSIGWFRKIEDINLRGDDYEGVASIRNYPSGKFEIKSINFVGKYEQLHLKETYKEIKGNLYSLYCISSFFIEDPFDFRIDPKVRDFGSHCLMIKDCQKFFLLMEEKLKSLDLQSRCGFIKYYEKNLVNGDISLFQKRNEYKYQNEFRYIVSRNEQTPLVLQLGSLKEISEVWKSEDILSLNLKLEE